MSSAGRWSYDKTPRMDRRGKRWHFVHHDIEAPAIPYDDRPFEIYFRDDERTQFGRIRFDRKKDFPYRSFEALAAKVVNNSAFRRSHLDPDSKVVWLRSWK